MDTIQTGKSFFSSSTNYWDLDRFAKLFKYRSIQDLVNFNGKRYHTTIHISIDSFSKNVKKSNKLDSK